jgi:hypothetical protein
MPWAKVVWRRKVPHFHREKKNMHCRGPSEMCDYAGENEISGVGAKQYQESQLPWQRSPCYNKLNLTVDP